MTARLDSLHCKPAILEKASISNPQLKLRSRYSCGDLVVHIHVLHSCLHVDVNAVSDDRMNGTQNNYHNPPCRGFNHIMVLLKYIFPFLLQMVMILMLHQKHLPLLLVVIMLKEVSSSTVNRSYHVYIYRAYTANCNTIATSIVNVLLRLINSLLVLL